jgi:NAD(P) transhydrogenase subunit beta
MELGFTTAAYVVSAVLFILSLGGLSGQESAKRAVWYGIVGMALAVFATLIGPGSGLWALSVVLIAAGGVIGYFLAAKVEMTQMPELVAGMHALVGLAAVFVGFNADLEIKNVATALDVGSVKELAGFAALVAKKIYSRDKYITSGVVLGGIHWCDYLHRINYSLREIVGSCNVSGC